MGDYLRMQYELHDMEKEKKLYSWIGEHVFGRIKIQIDDPEADEFYTFDLPPHIYEELKKVIKQFEKRIRKEKK